MYLITEFAHQGDLASIIKKDLSSVRSKILSDEQLRNITQQVMRGLLYLHQNNICHNDLKPSNIFVNGNYQVLMFCIELFLFALHGKLRILLWPQVMAL